MLYREGRVGLGGAKIFFGCGAGGGGEEGEVFLSQMLGCGAGGVGVRGLRASV